MIPQFHDHAAAKPAVAWLFVAYHGDTLDAVTRQAQGL